jgi:hypothetical protein
MKKIKLKDGTDIQICTEPNELTFLEVELFKQFFIKILYGLDDLIFDDFKYKIFEVLNKSKFAEAIVLFENFSQGLKLQSVELNSWAVCFAILLKKEKPILNDAELFDFFVEINEKGIDEVMLKNEVVNFTMPFPKLQNIWKVKSEGLTISDITNLLT